MFDISFGEIGIIAVIAIVVVGPEKLPAVIKSIGKLVGKIRSMTDNLKSEVERELNLSDIKSSLNDVTNHSELYEIKKQLLDTSKYANETLQSAKKNITTEIESHNTKFLATESPIQNFAFDDLNFSDTSSQARLHQKETIDDTFQLHDEFSEDFSDFYNDSAPFHNNNTEEYKIDNINKLSQMIKLRQTEINTPPCSPAALTHKINNLYKNRYLLADHELQEVYHTRLSELVQKE